MSIYNEPICWIEQSISSILSQTYKNIEFMIILDNPGDLNLLDYVKALAKRDNRIVVLENDINVGLGNSLNRGIQQATGEYIARMDADDISMKDRIAKEVEYLEENKLDLVATNIIDMDMGGILTGKGTSYPNKNKRIKEYLKYGSCLPHPTWLGKKNVFLKNPYSPLRACQDYELVARLAQKGYKLGVLPEALLQYRLNNNSISSKKKVFQKTVSFYVRDCYKSKKDISYSNLEAFLNSAQGRKKRECLEKYYLSVNELKESYRENRYVDFLIKGINLFLRSKEARDVLKEILITKII